jgi:Sigma-70 region 3
VSDLRPELEAVLEELLGASVPGGSVSLDHVGDALGSRAASTDEIDALIGALEAQGRIVVGPEGPGAEAHLVLVVRAARALTGSLGRRPTLSEIAEHAGLGRDEVLRGLALLRVMQR